MGTLGSLAVSVLEELSTASEHTLCPCQCSLCRDRARVTLTGQRCLHTAPNGAEPTLYKPLAPHVASMSQALHRRGGRARCKVVPWPGPESLCMHHARGQVRVSEDMNL
eukprot:3096059-Rhodomonas_salina.2